ncbi:MAG: GspE/PulE family protein [Ignavibacteria bacterium]|jgi:type IV pilus assembly protein PilB
MVNLENIPAEVSGLLQPEIAFENNILPLKRENGTLFVGLPDINDLKLINDLGFDTGLKIEPVEIPAEVILNKLKELYPDYEFQAGNGYQNGSGNITSDYSNVEFVNQVISAAIKSKVSDIHFEALEDSFRVRCRIDGYLREISRIPKQRSAGICSRIKVMANLDISERRRPQDGRIRFNYQGRDVDIRVSFLPANYGEKIVLRLLDKSQLKLDLSKLGLTNKQLELVQEKIKLPFGMILLTGPTGSGKTTTLYAALRHIHTIEKNILTVEDPIEYNLEGINQCNVKPDIGFDFANALRTFLRQDPDVIMVGEIRDSETAEIAIRSSLTGHLVFSTLHTNDSVSGISRLIDMGIEPFLVASSVKMIIAQRLVRTLCNCKVKETNPTITKEINSENIYKKKGCEKCNFTGYTGRTAIYEMFNVSEEIAEMISGHAATAEIKRKAKEQGFKTLRESGIEKILQGVSTYEEVLRETTL